MQLDQQVGAPRAWKFAGREWLVSGLTPYQLGRLTARLKDLVPNPLEAVKSLLKDGVFTPEERKALIEQARAEATPRYERRGARAYQVGGWPPSFGSQAASEIFFFGEGIAYFLWVVLSKHQPATKLADVEGLAAHFDVQDLRTLTDLIGVSGDAEDEDADEEDAAADEGDGGPEGYTDPKA